MFNDIWFNRTEEPKHHYHRGNKYNFSTDYHFEFEGTPHQLITAKCSWDNYRPILITIHDPTPEVLLYLQKFLDRMDYYHLKDVEFTYDFIFEDTGMVKQYFQEHAIVAWRGKGYQSDDDTFYANNIRFASGKGLRAYEKDVQDEDGEELEVARLEMRLKRPILKKNGLHNITDLFTMDNRIANKYWAFQSFNFKKLSKRMIEKNEILYQYDDVSNNIIDEIKEGYLYDMNQYCKEWCKRYNSDSYIKKNKFWDHFKLQFQCSSFLNGDSFKLSSFLMEDGV
ncbi:hypothetical protein KAJ27_02560 [bacterium]|nr:hypothetical protein [bacterium]